MNTRVLNPVIMILLATALATLGKAHAQKPDLPFNEDKPLFEIDTRKFAYERYSDKKAVRPIRIRIDFTDAGHLALVWAMPKGAPAPKNAGQPSPRPAHLHVILLDAKVGSKQGEGQWETSSAIFGFFGLRDGKFLICTRNTLRLFSAGFKVVREEALQEDNSCSYLAPGLGVSPSRQSLLLSRASKG